MTLVKLEPDVEAYGSDARPSALADVLELQALTGFSMNEAQLTDYIADAGWGARWADKFCDIGELDEEAAAPTARELAERTFRCLDRRALALGARYPFAFCTGHRVLRRAGAHHAPCAYDLLLAVSIAHSYPSLDFDIQPTRLIEDLCVRAFRAAGLRSEGLATRRRRGASYVEAVKRACESLGLQGDATRSVRRRRAHDGGTDVLAYLPLGPARKSVVTFITQATCARSDEWADKLGEPAVRKWSTTLGSHVSPIPMLAVPYHVMDNHLSDLEERHGGLVLDRLALATLLGGQLTTEDERAVERLVGVVVQAARWAPTGRLRRAAK